MGIARKVLKIYGRDLEKTLDFLVPGFPHCFSSSGLSSGAQVDPLLNGSSYCPPLLSHRHWRPSLCQPAPPTPAVTGTCVRGPRAYTPHPSLRIIAELAALGTARQLGGFKCPCVCTSSTPDEVSPASGCQGREDFNQGNA